MNKWRLKCHKLIALAIATCSVFLIVNNIVNNSVNSQLAAELPKPRVHPLPQFLANWQDPANSGDYFREIEATPVGYLIWSQFPVKVYVDKSASTENTAVEKRFREWTAAVDKAIAQWQVYFPLQEVAEPEKADIVVWRSQPKREIKLNPDTGLYDIPRAITAQTNYEFYLTKKPAVINLRMTVQLGDNFTGVTLLATIRHELGHALGIWGHSPKASDALYFSQVSDPPPISARDINTLKKIYQQPTRLGWGI
ncbi:MAG: peptidase [Pleurocapsa sp.]